MNLFQRTIISMLTVSFGIAPMGCDTDEHELTVRDALSEEEVTDVELGLGSIDPDLAMRDALEEEVTDVELGLGSIDPDPAMLDALEEGFTMGVTCPPGKEFEFMSPLTESTSDLAIAISPSASGGDNYVHRAGYHSGFIESWRLCYKGSNVYQICTGGYAPVRWYNPASCGGTIHDYWPQGWHVTSNSGGGCG